MKSWEEIEKACNNCKNCLLHETRGNIVLGVGNKNAEVMFVGEGPGEQEDLKGEPFVGRAGKLLDDMLAVIGLDRTKVYIANIVKCRPPGNRNPLNIEQDACIPYLRAQVKLIKPKIIVCLGKVAASRLIKEDFPISKEHGMWFEKGKYLFTAMYHPAYMLRSPSKKPEAFDDLKLLEAKILEICENTRPEAL